MKSLAQKFSTILVSLALTACAANPLQTKVKPKNEPTYNFTQSSQVLSCVGNFINLGNKPPVDIFISSIPDHTIPTIETGFLTKNAIMMVNTAFDRLQTELVSIVGNDGGMKDRLQVQVLGAFTELNRTMRSSAASGEVIIPGGFELEFGNDQAYNHIALDLALSYKNRIVPGTSTSVSIQIDGGSGDITLSYDEGDEFAAIGALGFSGQEGFHSAQRLLVETAVAIMMARFYSLDIRQCWNKTKKPSHESPVFDYDYPVFDVSTIDQKKEVLINSSVPNRVWMGDRETFLMSPAVNEPLYQPEVANPNPGIVIMPQGVTKQWDSNSERWDAPPYYYNQNSAIPSPVEAESLKLYQNRQSNFAVPAPPQPDISVTARQKTLFIQ